MPFALTHRSETLATYACSFALLSGATHRTHACVVRRLKSEYEYSSVVDHARSLLAHCKARTAVRARMGELDFLRAPDASCSSILLFAAGDAPTPVMLGDRAKFLDFLGARMAAARAECKDLWSVAFFFCDGPNLFGGLKVRQALGARSVVRACCCC